MLRFILCNVNLLKCTDSSEEERVAKSAKDRLFESIQTSVSQIRSAMKKHDFITIQQTYQNLIQNLSSSKSKAIITANGGVPRFFIKLLCDLEDFIVQR